MSSHTPVLIRLTEAWFDILDDRSALRIATDQPGLPLSFWCPTSIGNLHFTHVADIKNRRVFEASAWRSAGDPGQPEQDPTFLLEGPSKEERFTMVTDLALESIQAIQEEILHEIVHGPRRPDRQRPSPWPSRG